MAGLCASDIVLVTGANGHVASHIVQQLLLTDGGPKVRATVRSEKSMNALKNVFSKSIDAGRLSVHQVPDITEPGAFNNLIEDVSHIAHVASPMYFGTDDLDCKLIQPAVKGTTGLLMAAARQKSDTVKSVAITGSIAAVIDPTQGWPQKGKTYTSKDWDPITEDLISKAIASASTGQILSPFEAQFTQEAPYYYAKTTAEKAAWDFYEQHRKAKGIKWTMSTILPVKIGGPSVFPLGRSPDGKTIGLSSSQQVLVDVAQGQLAEGDFAHWVDVRDVAKMHIEALSRKEAEGQRLIASAGRLSLKALGQLAEEASPYWAPAENLPDLDSYSVDSGDALKTLGMDSWISPTRIVGDLLWQVEQLWSVC